MPERNGKWGDYGTPVSNDETFPQRSENARIDYFIQSSNYERSTPSVQQHPSGHVIQRRQQDISEASKLTNKNSYNHRHEPEKVADKGIKTLEKNV